MEPRVRRSAALEQFFSILQGQAGRSILDLSPVSQANVTYISGLGHRLFCEDFLASLDHEFGPGGGFFQAQENAARAEEFLERAFGDLEGPFHGILVWDGLQYLSPTLLDQTVQRLHRLAAPDAPLLAFFSSEERAKTVPTHYYRIQDARTLEMVERGPRPVAQYFNNRVIERILAPFSSLKFFLSRDHLREVLVRR